MRIRDKRFWFNYQTVAPTPSNGPMIGLGFGIAVIGMLMLFMSFAVMYSAPAGISMALSPFVLNLKDDRMKLVTQARAIMDKAGKEKRSMTADETTTYENLDKEIESLSKQILLGEKQDSIEQQINLSTERRPELGGDPPEGTVASADDPWLRVNVKRNPATNLHERTYAVAPVGVRGTDKYRRGYAAYLRDGLTDKVKAALQADSDTAGGYLVAPQQFIADLIQAVDDLLFVRQLATVTPVTSADSVGRPSLDADPADADWTSEIATGSEDSTMSVGKRELHPHPIAKRIKVSRKLLRLSSVGAEALVIQRLAYKQALTQEKGFLTGSGSNQPLGLFTASDDGIPTSRDISTDNTSSAITGDGLINALYSLKAQYQARAAWIFHRATVKMARKLKDTNTGQYLWQPGLQGGQPDRILDKPFYMSEWAPSTFTTGQYVGIVGDFSYYWIADALNMEIQRLTELYAASNQMGFISRSEVDGMPVLAEAFARVKLG